MSKSTIAYDICSIPVSFVLEDVEKLRTMGYIFYDSERGEKPFIMLDEEEKLEIIDSNSDKGKELLNKHK